MLGKEDGEGRSWVFSAVKQPMLRLRLFYQPICYGEREQEAFRAGVAGTTF